MIGKFLCGVLLGVAFLVTGCVSNQTTSAESQEKAVAQIEQTTEKKPPRSEVNGMKLLIGGTEVPVAWERNPSVDALKEISPLTVKMSMYGGFEQVGSIGRSLPRNNKQITTSSGDIVLYSGNQIVIFYGSNSWAYTKLGHIDLSQKEMTELLSYGDVEIKLLTD